MRLLRRLMTALERLANAWDAQNLFERESEKERGALNREQTVALDKVTAIQREALQRAEEWRAVEREHMKVCEERFQRRQLGKIVKDDEPIRH